MPPTKKKSHCCRLRRSKALNGLGAGFIGGISVGSRVIAYRRLLVKKPSCSCSRTGTSTGECFSSCSAMIQVCRSGPAEG